MYRILALVLVLAGSIVVLLSPSGFWKEVVDRVSSIHKDQSEVSDKEFASWVAGYVNALRWDGTERGNRLSHQLLKTSLELGRQFIIKNQKPDGSFNYEYDFVNELMAVDDNQVRQAGALWGLALIYQFQQTTAVGNALEKGLTFFFKHTRRGPASGSRLIKYPGDHNCKTGTVALVALAIIDYLRTENDGNTRITKSMRDELQQQLNGYLKYLEYMQLHNGHFSQSLSLRTGTRDRHSNPYFDGETLLALIKAAKYLGYDLIPLIDHAAITMAKRYTLGAWQEDKDSSQTKGFFQWGSMAFWEYQDAGWRHKKTLGDSVLALAWWMIYTHRTLERPRNTAYAYEGLIHAYRIAEARKHETAFKDLARIIDTGLFKLTSWQVGGPLEPLNPFLRLHSTEDPLAVGGVMNHSAEAPLRIDVTQHQMHAVILALQHVYTKDLRL